MGFSKFIYKLFNSPHKLMEEYKRSEDYRPALVWVFFTASSFVGFGIADDKGNDSRMLIGFAVIIAAYFAACFAFKIAAVVTGKKVKYIHIMSTWGHSYIATFTFLMYFTLFHIQLMPSNTSPNSIITFISMVLVVALVIWKAVMYFIELVVVLEENVSGILMSSLIIGAFFVLYYVFTAYVLGFKIPIF